MLKSLIMAFSTYSKIPTPKVKWNEKSMKYSMCFFPFVGVVIGFINVLVLNLFTHIQTDSLLPACILTVLPILITGGIHMDGFLDTVDAKSSYKSKEEKLDILKDPHTGAFAIIFAIVYMILYFGFIYQSLSDIRADKITEVNLCIALGYVYSRILSGLSVVMFRKAKKDGMVAATSDSSGAGVKWVLLIELAICISAFMLLSPVYGIAAVAAGVISFLYYFYTAYKNFGGVTGDLAGYFLQICELAILIFVVGTKLFI